MKSTALTSSLLSLVLASSSLLGCTGGRNDQTSRGSQAITATTDEDEPVCADCDLKEAIEAKKGQIKSKEALLRADKSSVQGLKDYNDALTQSIKDYDKKIATLNNSKMQGFKFVLEGALAVLEVESLVGLAKNVKCLVPTAKTPVIVKGVKVAGPDILKFGLALKDPKKMKMFVAKAALKGTLAAANDADQTWVAMAVGYIPLTSAMKLPQRWNEWINAGDLIAVLDDAKAKVEADIATNLESIKELEKVIPATEKRIEQLKEELAALEAELARGMCSADPSDPIDPTPIDPTPIDPTTPTPVIGGIDVIGATTVRTGLTPVRSAAAATAPGEDSGTIPGTDPAPVPGDSGSDSNTGPITDPAPACGDGSDADFIDYDDTEAGGDDACGGGGSDTDLPAPDADNTSFPWGYTF
jgi:peptidoglycan hydrolase CwlO-like protein